jgi:hypothetical protein
MLTLDNLCLTTHIKLGRKSKGSIWTDINLKCDSMIPGDIAVEHGPGDS